MRNIILIVLLLSLSSCYYHRGDFAEEIEWWEKYNPSSSILTSPISPSKKPCIFDTGTGPAVQCLDCAWDNEGNIVYCLPDE